MCPIIEVWWGLKWTFKFNCHLWDGVIHLWLVLILEGELNWLFLAWILSENMHLFYVGSKFKVLLNTTLDLSERLTYPQWQGMNGRSGIHVTVGWQSHRQVTCHHPTPTIIHYYSINCPKEIKLQISLSTAQLDATFNMRPPPQGPMATDDLVLSSSLSLSLPTHPSLIRSSEPGARRPKLQIPVGPTCGTFVSSCTGFVLL